jgi:hypothetical protein
MRKGEMRNGLQNFGWKHERERLHEDLGVDERIILKWILGK